MSSESTKTLLNLRQDLHSAFQDLYDSFEQHGSDGICISDVEFSLYEFCGKLEELKDALSK